MTEPAPETAARLSRDLVRSAPTAALASVHEKSGIPYASLVQMATTQNCQPILLVSDLAVHTKNLKQDARASILFARTGEAHDPLDEPRVTLMGRIARDDSPQVRERFLRRHAQAAGYAEFTDFGFYRLEVESAHFVGGFGRIEPVSAEELLIPDPLASEIAEAEEGIIAHMNADHADALALYARSWLGAEEGEWRMVGCDAEGFDMAGGGGPRRVAFEQPVTAVAEFRTAFATMSEIARGKAGN